MTVAVEIYYNKKLYKNQSFEVVPRRGELIIDKDKDRYRVIEVVHRAAADQPAQVLVHIDKLQPN